MNLATSAALAAVLLCNSPLASAQQKRGEASKAPTAGIEAPPRTAESLNYQRSPRQDSVMSGGSFGNLPSWSGTVPGPCEINPELAGCGGTSDPAPPPPGGGTGGTTDPTPPGGGGDGGGGTTDPTPPDGGTTDPTPPGGGTTDPTPPGGGGDGGGGSVPPKPVMTAKLWNTYYTVVDGGDGFATISGRFGNFYCSERDAIGKECGLPYLWSGGAPTVSGWAASCEEGDEYVEEYSPTGMSRAELSTIDTRVYMCVAAP